MEQVLVQYLPLAVRVGKSKAKGLLDPEEAESIAGEALWEAASTWEKKYSNGEDIPESFIVAIVRRRIIDRIRIVHGRTEEQRMKRKRAATALLQHEADTFFDPVAEKAEELEVIDVLRSIDLTDRERTYLLYRLDGRPASEAAAAHGVTGAIFTKVKKSAERKVALALGIPQKDSFPQKHFGERANKIAS